MPICVHMLSMSVETQKSFNGNLHTRLQYVHMHTNDTIHTFGKTNTMLNLHSVEYMGTYPVSRTDGLDLS